MIINPFPKIRYACPVCGHYFYESELVSYSSFGIQTTFFTDGYNTNFYHSGFTHCPRCKSVFHTQYLNEIDLSEDDHEKITSPEFCDEYFKKTGCAWYSCIDNDIFGAALSTKMFSKRWWRDTGKPLYFPESVHTEKRQEVQDLFNVNIWRIAHIRHFQWIRESALTIDNFMKAREALIESLCYSEPMISRDTTYDNLNDTRLDLVLVRAELARNNCSFDECLSLTEHLSEKHMATVERCGFRTRLETIRTAAQNKISQTLMLPKPKERW